MDICFCAFDGINSATEFYVFPVWDVVNNHSYYHHPRGYKPGWGEVIERSDVSDHHHHSIEVFIRKLSPRLRFFISPRRENLFAVINSVVYMTGSHLFPEKFVLHPGTEFIGECFKDVFGINPIPSGSTVIECAYRGRHLYRCLIGRSPALWEPCPLMNASRPLGSCPIAVDGKIHVVGGNNRLTEPIHEAFDPVRLQWRALAPPPAPWHEDTCNDAFLTAVVDNPTRLIVGSPIAKNFYIYHVSEDYWEILSTPDCKNHQFISGPAAVVGQTLYWLDYQKFRLIAFDLVEQKWLRGRIRGLDDGQKHFGSTLDSPPLLHVGGDLFCLVWTSVPNNAPVAVPHNIDSDSDDSDYNGNNVASSISSNENTGTHIHCAKIEVSKVIPYVKGKHGLNAFIRSCQCYVVDHDVSCLGAFIMKNNERMSF